MRQARFGRGSIGLIEADAPALRDGWVRLRVDACGICGTDLHLYRGEVPAAPDVTPGHEIVGHPIDGGKGLDDATYAVEPLTVCGTCEFCIAGDRQLCPTSKIIGILEPGGLAEIVDVPRYALHRVDASVPTEVASISEPLAVCVRAVHMAELEVSSRVLVLGGGTIGLLSGLLARDRAGEVAISVRHPQQREAAARLGLIPLGESDVRDWARDRGPDVVIETVGGSADTIDHAIGRCRPGGRVVVLGVFAGKRPINAFALMVKELTLVGSNTYGTGRRGLEFASAVELLPRYRSEIEPLQTHRFTLAKVADAFECADDKRSGAIKVTIVPDA